MSNPIGSACEPIRPLHPPPCHHYAPHARGDGVRGDGVSRTAGLRFARGRLPDHPGTGRSAGRQPRHDGLVSGAAARETVRQYPGPDRDELHQQSGQHQHHAAIRSRSRHRRGRTGRAGHDRPGIPQSSVADAGAAVVSEGQPGRSTGHLRRAAFQDIAAVGRRRVRTATRRATHLHHQGRCPGRCPRLAEVRRAHRCRSATTRHPIDRDRRGCDRHRQRQWKYAHRHHLRGRSDLRRPDQRSAAEGGGVRADHRRVPERQPGAAARGRARL